MGEEILKVVLAGLLHDIGKFKQRADFELDFGKAHTQIGYEWLVSKYGEGVISSAALQHHEKIPGDKINNAEAIIYEANRCSAILRQGGTDRGFKIDQPWHKEVQLKNTFTSVCRLYPDSSQQEIPISFYSLATLNRWSEPSCSEIQNMAGYYRKLWKDFEDEFTAVQGVNNHYNVDVMMHLLEKYTSFIPCISQNTWGDADRTAYRAGFDISLFDHLKMTSAVAACLLHYYIGEHVDCRGKDVIAHKADSKDRESNEVKPFMLIGGDLSGVQKFIYTISAKGALKALKGRSFFLELLMEHTVDRLLETTELHRSNVIFNGGGHFYLMAPNIPKALAAIETIRTEINDYLFEAFNGSIQLILESSLFGKNDFEDASVLWTSVAEKIEKAKQCKWEDRLDKILFEPLMPHHSCLKDNCEVCGREDIALDSLSEDKPGVQVCTHCRDQYRLGALIQDSVRRGQLPVIYRWDSPPDVERYIRIGKRYYQFAAGVLGKNKTTIVSQASAVFHLNDWDLNHYAHRFSRPLLAGVYLPKDPFCQDLEGMAQGGFGIPKIAVLRMDVDHLGRIFSKAVPKNERSLTRMASLSRQLNLFFKYHINGIIQGSPGYPRAFQFVEREAEKRVMVVYAGGDDLFLLGHWLDITESAFTIRNAFQQFTCNPQITISAGITWGEAHQAVYQLADAAGQAEQLAKNNGRDSITLLETHIFKWRDTDSVITLLRNLMDLCQVRDNRIYLPDDSISKNVIYRLLLLTREKTWILPKMAYVFGRSQPKKIEFIESWRQLKDYAFSKRVDWHHLEVAVLFNLMMMRKGENKDG